MADCYCMGIDLGTTSVKVTLSCANSKQLAFSTSEKTDADIAGKQFESVQNVDAIFSALTKCINRITEQKRLHVTCISVSGQMHGVVLWNSEDQNRSSSALYTWQDQRADAEFLAGLPKPDSHIHPATGYGCVTLFWLSKNDPEMLLRYNSVGTIADYLVTILCDLDSPVMGHQMAASWGYYNTDRKLWNTEILKEAGFPVHFLPVVLESGSQVGELSRDWLGVQKGTTVLASLGDLQCAFLSAAQNRTDAVLNMSTSCQLCYEVLCSGFIPPRTSTQMPVSHVPLFEGSYLAVVASLNGGNVLQKFVEMLKDWLAVFEVQITDDKVYDILGQMTDETTNQPIGAGDLSILPSIFGERHKPNLLGSVSGISGNNMSLTSVFRALCRGLVQNISLMLPCSKLMESGIQRLCISGSVIERQKYVKECVKELYSPLEIYHGSGTDSAEGAATVALNFVSAKKYF